MAFINVPQEAIDSEKKVFNFLKNECAESLPKDDYQGYANLNLFVPGATRFPLECDLILIAKTVVWLIEIKDYNGRISGSTEYLRFQNGATISNPFPTLNNKARILGTILKRLDVRHTKVIQRIVYLNPETRFHVRDPQFGRFVGHYKDLPEVIRAEDERDNLEIRPPERAKLKDAFSPNEGTRLAANRFENYEVIDILQEELSEKVMVVKNTDVPGLPSQRLRRFIIDPTLTDAEIKAEKERLGRGYLALYNLPNHPNVCGPVQPPNFVLNQYYCVLYPHQEGRPLADVLYDEPDDELTKPLDAKAKFNVLADIARGLIHLHQHKIVHRRLGPQHVWVNNEGKAQIIDFMAAKDLSGSTATIATQMTNSLMGDLFVADEVKMNRSNVTEASDVYSLGMIAYQLFDKDRSYINDKSIDPDVPSKILELPENLKSFAKDLAKLIRASIKDSPDSRPSVQDYLDFFELLLSDTAE